MSVTAVEVLNAARLRATALTGETAGYLVLLATEAAGAPGSSGMADPARLLLSEDGAVTVTVADGRSEEACEAGLRALLSALLSCAPPSAPALGRVATGPSAGLSRLVAEIEAALIPVNRGAGRRALARLHRDVAKARALGKLEDAPSAGLPAPAPVVAAPPAPVVPAPAPVVPAPVAPVVAAPPAPVVTAPVVPRSPGVDAASVAPSTAVAAARTPPLPSVVGLVAAPLSPPVAQPVPDEVGMLETEPTPFLGSHHLSFAPRPGRRPSRVADTAPVDPQPDWAPEMSSKPTPVVSVAEAVAPVPSSAGDARLPPATAPGTEAAAAVAPARPSASPTSYRPRRSDVTELLDGFAVAEARTLREISRELKEIAGVAGTPCPPRVAEALSVRSR